LLKNISWILQYIERGIVIRNNRRNQMINKSRVKERTVTGLDYQFG
jgi:hypothetical protein